MARNIDSRPKSIDVEQTVLRDAKSFRMLGISEHLQKLGREVELSGIVTNPDAVRMVACQPEESAYELASTRGGRHGAMTDALATVLDGLGDAAVPWAVVGDLVRRRVRALQPEQRPEVEGPSERLPFSAASAAASDALAITTIRGVSTVEAGELLGLAVGDELDIVAAADGERVGEATVKELAGGAAVLQRRGCRGRRHRRRHRHRRAPQHQRAEAVRAHRRRRARRRRPAPRDRAQHAPRRHRAAGRGHRRCRPRSRRRQRHAARRRRCAVARHPVRRRRGRTPRARRFPAGAGGRSSPARPLVRHRRQLAGPSGGRAVRTASTPAGRRRRTRRWPCTASG